MEVKSVTDCLKIFDFAIVENIIVSPHLKTFINTF